MSELVKQLFTEKFRPKELNLLIAPPRVKEELSKGLVQNILLYGGPGTGKTSTAWILAKGHTTKYINASSERGIDTIRDEISKFCASMSLMDGNEQLKCVILDEIDNATNDFFMALRGVMEKYSNVTRFVATCNFLPKVPEPIQSRFHMISYDPLTTQEEEYLTLEYKTRIGIIMDKIGIKYTDDILGKFIVSNFPDMRAIMSKLQSLYLREIKELNDGNFHAQFDYEDLFELCVSKPDKPHNNYKFIVSQYANRIDEALIALGKDFPDYLKSKYPEKDAKLPVVIIAIAEYQYQKAFTIDPMITLLATVFKCQTILS